MALPASPNSLAFSQISTEMGYGSDTLRTLNESAVRTLLAAGASGAVAISGGRGRSYCSAAGTYVTQYCSGYNLYRRYYSGSASNGTCGTYDSLYQSNSSTCGYNPAIVYSLYCYGDPYICTGCGNDDDGAGGLQSCINCGYYTWACAGAYDSAVSNCYIYVGGGCGSGSAYYVGTGSGRCSGGCI